MLYDRSLPATSSFFRSTGNPFSKVCARTSPRGPRTNTYSISSSEPLKSLTSISSSKNFLVNIGLMLSWAILLAMETPLFSSFPWSCLYRVVFTNIIIAMPISRTIPIVPARNLTRKLIGVITSYFAFFFFICSPATQAFISRMES